MFTNVTSGCLFVIMIGGIPQVGSGGVFAPDSTEGTADEWEYSASAYGYWVQGEDFFILPVFTADLGSLHLEGRYNYENFRTASVFAGWNMSVGSSLTVGTTPMVGFAFGQTNGLVPALEVDILYGPLELYVEAEYLFDLEDHAASYFYTWSELSVSPMEWLYAGISAQRTRVVQNELDISRGILVGAGWENISGTMYFFEPGSDEAFFILGLEWLF